ncbi:hypothetical protein CB1_000313055, partial [Camelus ferus]
MMESVTETWAGRAPRLPGEGGGCQALRQEISWTFPPCTEGIGIVKMNQPKSSTVIKQHHWEPGPVTAIFNSASEHLATSMWPQDPPSLLTCAGQGHRATTHSYSKHSFAKLCSCVQSSKLSDVGSSFCTLSQIKRDDAISDTSLSIYAMVNSVFISASSMHEAFRRTSQG